MKKLITIILLIFILFMTAFSQQYEIYKGDTINKIDLQGFKQGYWIKFSDDRKQIVEEGKYIDNKKTGIWKKYYPSGKIQSEITYVNNKPDGYAKFYYENGIVSEEGIWKGNKWVGEYKYYHTSGTPQYAFNYDTEGKRTGIQKYFHENGNLMIEGEWRGGKETGVIKEYYEDGTLKAEKNFINGELDSTSVKQYEKKPVEKKPEIAEKQPAITPTPKTTQTSTTTTENPKPQKQPSNTTNDPSLGFFNGNGYHKLYNKNQQIEREGEFSNGKLINGKRYIYDTEGKLIKVIEYKNGNIVKDKDAEDKKKTK